MANASSKKFGAGQQDQGKGDGSGGMGPADPEITPRTEILSNRDTSRHSDERGLDSRHVQNEQLQDRESDQTGDAALATALDYVRAIKKTPIVVHDSRGFFTSRVFGTFTNEGIAMLGEGVSAAMIENEIAKFEKPDHER